MRQKKAKPQHVVVGIPNFLYLFIPDFYNILAGGLVIDL